MTTIKEDGSQVITFTDITAIHNAMFKDENTKLPGRKFTLEKIELLKQKSTSINVILMSLKHYSNLEKIYGKKDAIDVEVEFAQSIKDIRDKLLKETFIGHLNKNMFLIVPPEDVDSTKLYSELKEIKTINAELTLKARKKDIGLDLFTNISNYKIDTSLELNHIEINLMNAFETM